MATPSFGESLVQHTISGLLLRWLELHISRLTGSLLQQADVDALMTVPVGGVPP
jgi:Na+-transporting NADH:ubiquinone oxidoreductase subunit NqrB